MCCCILEPKRLKFQIIEYYDVLNEKFFYVFQIQIASQMSKLNKEPLLNDMSNVHLSYSEKIIAI